MASFSGWTPINSPTLTAETTIKWLGSQSMKVVAGGSVGRIYQALTANVKEVVGRTLRFRVWVYCSASSTARIGASFDGGSTFTYTAYHGGQAEWEQLDFSVAVPASASSIRVYLEVVASGTAYFDAAAAWIGTVHRYAVPTSMRFVDRLYQQVQDSYTSEWAPVALGNPPVSGRILKVVGRGTLTLPTSDTATMEVGDWEMEPLLKAAASELLGMVAAATSGQDKTGFRGEAALAQDEFERMLARGNYGQHVAWSNRGGGAWNTQNEGGTLYLYLER